MLSLFGKRNNFIDTLFERTSRLQPINTVFDRRFNRVIRNLAIILPCCLICVTIVVGNVRAKDLNGRSMSQQVVFDERVNGRSVVVAMSLGEENLTKSWGESSVKIGTGGNKSVTFGKQPGEPIANNRTYECAKDRECPPDKGDFVSTGIHFKLLLYMAAAGFCGRVIALLIIAAVFHFAFGLPLPYIKT